jgi:cytoskeletal protein RodZ
MLYFHKIHYKSNMLRDFGQDLKDRRESHNITIAEISAQTRINTKFLNLMEAGVFDFQPETYIRAFLKEYAKCLGESENVILTDYEKAKAGFYVRKSSAGESGKEESPHSIKPVSESKESERGESKGFTQKDGPSDRRTEDWPPPEIRKKAADDKQKELSNKSLTRKILIGLLIILLIIAIYYLVDYLNNSGNNSTSNVKPKSFSEMSEDYENKIKGMKSSDTNSTIEDSAKTVTGDSLELGIVASKDVRIKVYVDEKKLIEDVIPAKDTMFIYAKQQFRFSASANSSVDIYLNGKYLRKPSWLSGSSIKNLVINKDGFVNE